MSRARCTLLDELPPRALDFSPHRRRGPSLFDVSGTEDPLQDRGTDCTSTTARWTLTLHIVTAAGAASDASEQDVIVARLAMPTPPSDGPVTSPNT